MIKFKTFLLELADPGMYDKLARLGYEKVKQGVTKSTLFVYVPKSQREDALKDLADKLNAPIDSSLKAKNLSSIGAIALPGNVYIAVKPDVDKSLNTDEQESLAGLYIATMMNYPTTDFTYDELVKYGDSSLYSKYDANMLYEKASKAWLKSSETIARTVYSYIRGKSYQVHQRSRSKFVSNISVAAQRLIKESGVNARLDKWNPSDIWLVSANLVSTDFSQFKTIGELNGWMLEQFKAKKMIGVSLKAVGKTAKIEEFNTEQRTARNLNYESYNLGKTGFANAMDMTVFFDQGAMNIRAFGRPQNVSGDVVGKKARGGKIGAGQLFSVVRKYNANFSTPSDKQIASSFAKNPTTVTSNLYQKMKRLVPTEAARVTEEEFHNLVMKKDNALTYVISKTQVADIAVAIEGMSRANRNAMLEEMFDYASSSLSISSVFIKVS
jgi:hypothetical protein